MTQLPTGAYRPGDSIMHGLDTSMKLICFFFLIIAVLTTDTPAGYTGMLLFTMAATYLARMELKCALGRIRRLWWLFLLVIFSNFVFYAPEETFGAWWVFTPSFKGLYKGVCIAIRIAMLLILSDVLTSTTAPIKLMSAFETVLAPLNLIKVPLDRFFVVLETSTRNIPTIFQDAETIRFAQKTRGLTFTSKGFFDKARTAMPLVLPLIITEFRRADKLSCVLESRGFRGGTKPLAVKKPEPSTCDWAAVLVCAAVCAMQIIVL